MSITATEQAAPAGATHHTLTAPDGTTWDLGDYTNTFLTLGRRGYDSPPYQVYADESPGFDGEVFTGARTTARNMIIPLYVRGADRNQFLTRKRQLLTALSPRRGLATITVAETDGSQRTIQAFYTGRGGEGDLQRDNQGRTWARFTLEFRAPDPYWRGQPLHYEFTNAAPGSFYPILPLRVSSGTTLGTSTVYVPGEVEAFPVWTVHGPTSGGISLQYQGGGRALNLTSNLTAAEQITIDTDPVRLTIADQAGNNRWADLQGGSSLFPLPPGDATIIVTAAGATPATRITLDIQPRYETV